MFRMKWLGVAMDNHNVSFKFSLSSLFALTIIRKGATKV